jgi:hypothetical protein
MPKASKESSSLTVRLRNITRTDNRPNSIKPMAATDVASIGQNIVGGVPFVVVGGSGGGGDAEKKKPSVSRA